MFWSSPDPKHCNISSTFGWHAAAVTAADAADVDVVADIDADVDRS